MLPSRPLRSFERSSDSSQPGRHTTTTLTRHFTISNRHKGWPAGYLSMALSRLVGDADASFQQQLEDRVERLMSSRGVAHDWGDDLKPLKALRFDIEGSVV